MSKRHELLMLEIPHLSLCAFRPIGKHMILCDGGGGGGGGAAAGPDFSGGFTDSGTVGGNADVGGMAGMGDGGAAAQAEANAIAAANAAAAQAAAEAQAAAQAQAAAEAAAQAQAQAEAQASAQAQAEAQAAAQAQAAAEAAMAQAAAEALAASNEIGYGQLGEQSDFGDVSAISAAQNAIANNSLTQSQAIAAANALSKGTGMNPVDALMAVTGAYGTANPSDISGPMHSSGISYADIAVAQALGLGNQDVNSGQTVDQALAAANVHQAMPSVIGTIFGMAGSPMLGQLSKGLAQIGMGQNTLGGLISSMGLNALASQLGVPAGFVSLLAQTDLGKSTVSGLANTIDSALAGGLLGTSTTDTGSTGFTGSDSGAGGSGSDLTQTGYEITPVPTDWKSPVYDMRFSPSAPIDFGLIDFGTRDLLKGTQWEKPLDLSSVINTINSQQTFSNPAPEYLTQFNQPYNVGVNDQIGSLNGSPVSISDIIASIQSQYGQTPTIAVG